jgi:hypothetical protein
MTRLSLVFLPLLLIVARPSAGQAPEDRFQLGVQLAEVAVPEFDDTDAGIGVRFSWHATRLVGAEAEVDIYPRAFADAPAFSSSRLEGLFGVTVGPTLGRLRPFGKLRPGFLAFREASQPFACIAIFPPPLACVLASGRTVFALDMGGGAEWFPTGRTVLRVDAGDRLVRYPGPAFRRNRTAFEDASYGHDFRFTIGGGVRF